ncbi:hypothetical protein Tsubulata_026846 [Turnera subulata]|uniref:FHA domain-containing protein n=1 Tax=Turnera subulata TaxID=218843 RepID=A0A9Q0EXY0_9ROSI|nr:hypothetical protein Tsubulata_026846 [Turnera subulata]
MASDGEASTHKHRRSPSDDEAEKSSKRHKHRHHRHRHHRHRSKRHEEKSEPVGEEVASAAAAAAATPPPPEVAAAIGNGAVDDDVEEAEILDEENGKGDSRNLPTNSRGAEERNGNDDDDSLAKMKAAEDALEANQKQKPSFELSGKLAAETNRFRGITLLFNEPPDARKPDIRWRLYVFKGGDFLNEPLYIHRQSCYLFGRERRVADIPTDHPSCSKQHAVIQFRQVEEELPDGTTLKQVKPYIMDLGSTNKTYVNDNPIEPQRYYELLEKDTIKFGNSRYVGFYTASVFDFMHAGSSILMLLYANTGETQSFPP